MINFDFKPNLRISDVFAIKHALQIQVDNKNKRLMEICSSADWNDELEIEYNRLLKDVKREKELINYCSINIKEFLDSKKHFKIG